MFRCAAAVRPDAAVEHIVLPLISAIQAELPDQGAPLLAANNTIPAAGVVPHSHALAAAHSSAQAYAACHVVWRMR
jgi:hypothetical protein